MKTKKLVFTLSCSVLLIILAFSLYKSYFQNPVSVHSDATAKTEFNAASMSFSETFSEPATNIITENTEKSGNISTNTPIDDDFSCFDNSVFIGNSRFISFKNYGLCKNVYSIVGLTVDTIFTKSASGNGTTAIDSLYGKDYEKVIIMLGDNECGWPNQDIFIERYAKVIKAVRERVPNAEIYIHAVLPVSAEASAKNNFGCNNNVINSLNIKIKQLCEDEGIKFIEQPSCLKDTDGALLPKAANDGIHINKSYSEIWLDHLKKTIL